MDYPVTEERNVSCRITKTLLAYLRPSESELTFLLEDTPYSGDYIDDGSNWISASDREHIWQKAIEMNDDPSLLFNVGKSMANTKGLGRIISLVRLLGTPKVAYESIPKYSRWFDKDLRYEVKLLSEEKAKVTLFKPDYLPASSNVCQFTQGILAALPTIWDLPPARIHETHCMGQKEGESSQEHPGCCEYIVTWEPFQHSFKDKLNIYTFFPFLKKLAIKSIEEDLSLADRKNAELSLRNLQISKIREMALEVMKPKSKEQLFTSIVELIREIPSMRFVCIVSWEKKNQTLSVPYYSRTRDTAIRKALHTVGFDFDRILGSNPNSNILMVDVDQSVTFKQLTSKPEMKIFNSLAYLMDGVWSRGFCEAIQRIVGFKHIGVIPVIINNEFKAGIVTLLDRKVETDILEMIWSHCHAAIQNLENIEALQKKNIELKKANEVLIQARSDLEESEKRYRLLAENMSDAIWIMDRKLNITWVSPSAERLRGYTLQEISSMPLNKHLTPASLRIALNLFSKAFSRYVMHPQEYLHVQTELEFYHKEGHTIWVECQFSVLRDSNRKGLSILAEGRDITERKEAEEKLALEEQNFRNSLDNSPLGIQIISQKGVILYANQAMLDIYGFDTIEELRKPVYERYTEESYREHERRIELMDSGQKIPMSYEINVKRKDGQIRHLLVTHKETIWDKQKQYQILYQDITETNQMHQQLILADRLVSIGELAAGIAHEINNPLTSIIMYSEYLKDVVDLPEKIQEDITIINSEANRAAEIIQKMIIFARKHEIFTLPVNLNDVINDTLSLRTYEHKVKNIEVKKILPPDLPLIPGDAFQLQQVFLNIIINAEFFMYENNRKGLLEIKTETVGDIARISFTDDGPGIEQENLAHLFDPFFTTKEVGKGTGLGLSICHGIIEGYGGKIYAKSKPGHGATFIVELPVNE